LALNDEYASVRYWAVVGLHFNCPALSEVEGKEGPDRKQAETALQKMLEDPAPVVRIAAAHTLCDWGKEEEALPVLVEGLDCKTDKARLFAVTALNKTGEKARPALEQIKAHEKDPDNYVQRVTDAMLKGLGP
jgi:HEAT repeat protein